MHQEAIHDIVECPNCNSPLLSSGSELVCSKCGLVVNTLDRYVIHPCENRIFQKEPYYGSIIENKMPARNLSILHKRISSQEKGKCELIWLIDKLCDNFHLGHSIKLESHRIGLNLFCASKRNHERINKAAIATYSVITAARFHGLSIPLHYKRIRTYLQNIGLRVKTRDIFRVISVAREIGLMETRSDADKAIIEIISMIIRNNNRLEKLKPEDKDGFIRNLKVISLKIFNDLKSRHYYFRSKNPMICIASVIYAASREAAAITNIKNPITQRELAEYIGYAEYSVRETYEELFGKSSAVSNSSQSSQ
ncbi:MAG: hypothetical protein RMI79_02015 [Nitrososphaerota archaeon]|nr:hypothetical protein [Nitrososphaerota archaeon]